jgi:hypothetical protein
VTLARFALIVVAIVAVSGGATSFLDDAAQRAAALYGAGVATLNALGAFAVMRWAEGRPTAAFLTAVLGGMGVRMVGVLLAVLLAVLVFDLPRLALAASLLGHFAVFLVLEMIAVQAARPTMAGAR